MRVLEPRWRLRARWVIDVIRAVERDPFRNTVQSCIPPDAVSDDMIRTCAITAHAEPTNYFATRIQSHPATERNDAPRYATNTSALRLESWIEWI